LIEEKKKEFFSDWCSC